MQTTFSDDAAKGPAVLVSDHTASPGNTPPSPAPRDRPQLDSAPAIKLAAEIRQRLCCPVCGAPLESVGNELDCTGERCGKRYPSVKGIPILVDDSRSIFSTESFLCETPHFFQPVGPFRRLLSDWLPSLSHNIAARNMLGRMRDCLLTQSPHPKVLVVGGGEVGAGVDALVDDPAITVVHSDVSVRDHVDCICDGHDLPFQDGAFDGVVVQAVLEHVLDPVRCVEEIHRVLRDDGVVYSDTPFICQIHGREFEFTRYTRLGHRRLFRRFEEISSGISSGPGTALGWTLRYFFLSFLTRPLLRTVAGGLSRLAFFWLKYLDYILADKPAAMDTAFAFYFLGRKSREVLSDEDLLASYCGGF